MLIQSVRRSWGAAGWRVSPRSRLGAGLLLFGLGALLLSWQPAAAQGLGTRDAGGQSSNILPENLQDVGFDQRLGEPLPLDATFLDESGNSVRLGSYFGERPVILALVYYECPMLCTLVLDGVSRALKGVTFEPGSEFDVVAVSFDPGETPAMAAAAKEETLSRYGGSDTARGWHFLTGNEDSIRQLTEAAGFRYRYDEKTDEYAHVGGIVVATSSGEISRYAFGVDYAPRDVRLALVEASENRIGSAVDQFLLFCFHYDPATGKYSAAVLNLVRAGGIVTLLSLGLAMGLMTRRRRAELTPRTLGNA